MDCSYVNRIIEKYDNNGQFTQNEKTAYANLSQILNNWFNANFGGNYTYYVPSLLQYSFRSVKISLSVTYSNEVSL